MTLLLCQVMADFANYDSSSDNGDDDFGVWGGGFPEGAVARRRRRRDAFRCFGPCFPWFTGGGTTQEVLDNAGIVVFSDAYIHNIDSKFANQSTDFTSAAILFIFYVIASQNSRQIWRSIYYIDVNLLINLVKLFLCFYRLSNRITMM